MLSLGVLGNTMIHSLKGDVELRSFCLKPSRLQILVALPIGLTSCGFRHLSVSVDLDVLTFVGVWPASPLLMVWLVKSRLPRRFDLELDSLEGAVPWWWKVPCC
ncbi:hypothetical protein Nepgr_023120 [Nepenthes gracilis]|uniref:Uncharacterized protein n=1 Tax=Nepenthes gracilis TaxID=150966 RepID=A0AAD3T1H0_NEPGR|nr:hypothetical protein Nepgr_023120 [Nepenthes gracilis]